MKRVYIKLIVYLLLASQLVLYFPQQIFAEYEIEDLGEGKINNYVAPSDSNGSFEATPYDEQLDDPVSTAPLVSGPDPDNSSNANNPSKVTSNKFPYDKIILNASDKRKIEQTYKLAKNIPDLTDPANLSELARLSKRNEAELATLQATNPAQFYLIASETKSKTQNDTYLKQRLMNDPVALADVLFTTPEVISNELQVDKSSVENALDEAIATQIDIRILKTLVYLITPKDQGGAGHWRIRVKRITQNYDRESTKYQKEDLAVRQQNENNQTAETTTVEQLRADTDESTASLESDLNNASNAVADIIDQKGNRVSTAYLGNKEEDNKLVSAHYYGQAIDISEIDDIKCTVIGRKRIGSDDKKPQAPRPVKFQWQTTEGYSADKDNVDSSFNNMFLNNSRESLLEMLSQLNLDFESVGDLSNASMSDLLNLVGQAFLLNAINSPSGDIWKFNLSDTLRKLGGVILADNLALPRNVFLDTNINSIDDLQVTLGRSVAEDNLNLPYGALKGNTRDEVLQSIGRARILNELNLPSDILNYEIKDSADLYQRIGSRILENDLGLNSGSFYGKGSLSDIYKSAGKYRIESLQSFRGELDDRFSLASGTFSRFFSGTISPGDLNRLVAEAHFVQFVAMYNNTDHVSGSTNTATISLPSGQVSNLRDDVFDLPEGMVDHFLRWRYWQ